MEIIQKNRRNNTAAPFGAEAYVTFKNSMCSFNSKARDNILPYRHVSVIRLDSGNLMFKGTDNEDDFKMTIYKPTGQASISRCSINHYIPHKGKYRIPCELLSNHQVLLRVDQLQEY